jgi:hypothetical protein
MVRAFFFELWIHHSAFSRFQCINDYKVLQSSMSATRTQPSKRSDEDVESASVISDKVESCAFMSYLLNPTPDDGHDTGAIRRHNAWLGFF